MFDYLKTCTYNSVTNGRIVPAYLDLIKKNISAN